MNKKIFIIASLLLILDQVSKSILEIFFELESSIVIIKDFFYITILHNTGGAWSILNNYNFILIIISFVAIIMLIKFMYWFKKNWRNTIAFSCLLAGITSNLADRLFLGYVRDFLDFKIFGYDFPVFNIADITIVIGVILLVIAIIKGEDKHESSK